MFAYIFIFVLALTPALQAVFDLTLQLALQRAVLCASAAWLLLQARGAGLPAGLGSRKFYPLWAAALLTLLSLLFSPLRGWVYNEWGNYAAGLLVFLFASCIDKESRDRVERGILWGGWLVFSVSVGQVFLLRNFAALPPLTNLNALALYAVMLLPLALGRRNWALAAAMAVLVVWTQSLGAALAGLAAAGAYALSRPGGRQWRENLLPLAALGALAAFVFYLLQADSVAGRLAWWRSAWEMFLARPLSGFGHASYTWAQAAFQPDGAFREHAIYAHNYYLEFLAENGLPAAAAWFWLIFSALRRRQGLAKYALVAALAHSLVDFGLSVPANFWIFCWLLASPVEETPTEKPARPALAAGAVLAALLAAALLALDLRSLAFERARGRALAAAAAGGLPAAEAALAPALVPGLLRGPALEFLGRLAAADKTAPPGYRSAVYYEMALLENRYCAGAWGALRRIYSAPGLEARAEGLERRRREVYE